MKAMQVSFNTFVAVTGALLVAFYIVFGGSFNNKQPKKKTRQKGKFFYNS